MSFFNIFSTCQISFTDNVLNTGLRILLNAPFNSNTEIKEKLLIKFPSLTQEQIVENEIVCREAYKFGHDIIYDIMVKRLKALDPMTEQELKNFYRQEMTNRFPWTIKRNLKSIYNLASYSLGHDGWFEFKK